MAYSDEIHQREIADEVRRVGELVAYIEPFKLNAIPLAGSPGAIRLSVAPWAPVLQLYQLTRREGSRIEPDPIDVFRPHIGIAYSSRQQEARPHVEAVKRIADSEPAVSADIDRLQLVKMERATGYYRWDTLAELQFNG